MEVVLLGTGASDGYPNAFCSCASCRAARAAGEQRVPVAALVDGVLLIECGGGVPVGAGRLGLDLGGVRHVLVTHAHADHWQPQVLVGRTWSTADTPLDLAGPPAVTSRLPARAEPWLRVHPMGAGELLRLGGPGGYEVRTLAANHAGAEAGPALLYDVTGPDGSRLLWATDTGPLPDSTLDAVTDAEFDAVFLDETYGDGPSYAGADHLGLASFAATIAELRRRRAVTDRTRVCAVHLGHGNPPARQLAERLAAWGADAPADGSHLVLGEPRAGGARAPGRRVLVLGGARSGKSAYAERLLLAEPEVTYVATAADRPGDADWAARVAAHRTRRPAGWRTVATPDVAKVLRTATGPVLVDCVSLWLAGVLDPPEGWAPPGDGDPAAFVDELVAAWQAARGPVVAVSSEVGLGVVPSTAAGRRFRDELGRVNARLAAAADEVWLVTAGIARRLK